MTPESQLSSIKHRVCNSHGAWWCTFGIFVASGAPARGGIKSNPLSSPPASVNSDSPKYQTGVGEGEKKKKVEQCPRKI